MIQRIQSVYLLLVAIISGGLIFVFDLWRISEVKKFAVDLFSDESMLNKLVPILFFLSAFVAIVSIFSFKDRLKQFVLGRVIILINLFLLGVLIYLSLNLPGEVTSEKGIGMFIPTVAILFTVLANKAIKKDEDLVKSVDRLR
tara:strand:- start:4226 stop:4654 length:429 start_codon:yes stop_codon:yes gene_type:complete